jgi:hypothetical protein
MPRRASFPTDSAAFPGRLFAAVSLAFALVAPLSPSPSTALAASSKSSDDRWLHVSVDGTADDPERVRIHLPMKLVAALEPVIRKHGLDDDGFSWRVNGAEFDRADLRAILEAVKSSKDGEFIAVDDAEDRVRVVKEKDVLVVQVRERGGDDSEPSKPGKHAKGARDEEDAREKADVEIETEEVDIRIPISVAEALVQGEGDELDLGAAIEALAKLDSTELVSVKDGEDRVRIWIDTKNTAD